MKHTLRLAVAFLLPLAFAAVLAGCLVSEEDDYAVTLNEDGKSGAMTLVMFNVQSDQREPAKQKEDFRELMRIWKSDEYLLEKTKEGVYVKDRELIARTGKLIWTESSIFADLATLFPNEIVADTLRFSLGKDASVVSTNGSVVRMADTTRVLWPLSTRTYKLRIRHNDFQPTSDFVEEFRRRSRK